MGDNAQTTHDQSRHFSFFRGKHTAYGRIPRTCFGCSPAAWTGCLSHVAGSAISFRIRMEWDSSKTVPECGCFKVRLKPVEVTPVSVLICEGSPEKNHELMPSMWIFQWLWFLSVSILHLTSLRTFIDLKPIRYDIVRSGNYQLLHVYVKYCNVLTLDFSTLIVRFVFTLVDNPTWASPIVTVDKSCLRAWLSTVTSTVLLRRVGTASVPHHDLVGRHATRQRARRCGPLSPYWYAAIDCTWKHLITSSSGIHVATHVSSC